MLWLGVLRQRWRKGGGKKRPHFNPFAPPLVFGKAPPHGGWSFCSLAAARGSHGDFGLAGWQGDDIYLLGFVNKILWRAEARMGGGGGRLMLRGRRVKAIQHSETVV